MAKSKIPKNLQVDGTPKLAARAKPSDKHEKAELNIEEATVASPRITRQRAGEFFDFEGEDSGDEEPSSKSGASKTKKKTKTTAANNAGKLSDNLDIEGEDTAEEEPSSKSAAPKERKRTNATAADKAAKPKRRGNDLDVDGTSKLAAKSKPTDMHEQADLNIEEATVAAIEVEKLGKDAVKSKKKGNDLEIASTSKPATKHGRSRKHEQAGLDIEEATVATIEIEKVGKGAAKPKKRGNDLDVDGTSKLAAKSKPTDKHEQANLSIEEATVAAIEVEKLGEDVAKPAAKGKKGKAAKDEAAEAVDEDEAREPKIAKKDAPKKDKAASSKKSKKDNRKAVADGDDVPKVAVSKPEGKSKKPEVASKKDTTRKESAAIESDVAMDEGPFENLLESRKGKAPEDGVGKSSEEEKSNKGRKAAKKTAKELKVPNAKPSSSTTAETTAKAADSLNKKTKAEAEKGKKTVTAEVPSTETVAEAADTAKKQIKARAEKAKQTAKDNAPSTEKAAEVVDTAKNKTKTAVEKGKKAVKDNAPSTETAAEIADALKKQTKAGAEKVKKNAKANAPSAETSAAVADVVQKEARAAPEKAKKAVKPKEDSKSTKKTAPADETSKPEDYKSKKRKAPAVDAEEVKADILDPLSEHAEASAKKKQKQDKAKSKSIGDAVGSLISSAAEGANAARASLGGLASTLMGGATEAMDGVLESAGDATEAAKSAAAKATGKGKAVAEDVADSVGVAIDGVVESAADATETAKSAAAKATGKGKAVAEDVAGSVGMAIDGVVESAADATESAKSAAKTAKGKGKAVAEDVVESVGLAIDGVMESAADATESAKSVARKAKGKGKAVAEDVAESVGKVIDGVVESAANATEDESDGDESDEDLEPDDQTAALLAGFESDGDEAAVSGPGFEKGQNLPEMPHEKATKKKLKGIKADTDEGPGVVYVGRIPHGFYEHEMRQYFSQFGDINRLRLSRNKKTGASRHWAFIEFKSTGVAKIVADTMNNYLMFGHILKCRVVPEEQLHVNVWKGADKRFKKVPWNKLEGKKHEVAVGRDQWNARNENEEKRRKSKQEKMKEIGYEFEALPLKGVDQVPVKDTAKEVETGEIFEEEKSLVTAGGDDAAEPVVIREEVKTKKTKKMAKGEATETTTTVMMKTKRALETGGEAAGSVAKKAKKVKGAAA